LLPIPGDTAVSNEPTPPQQGPYVITEPEVRNIAWCSCGHSKTQPFCDGSHKGTGFTPVVMKCQPGEVAYCGCKRTKTPPYCDGSHNDVD
jgi:CDGSH-type Zn-finger protein